MSNTENAMHYDNDEKESLIKKFSLSKMFINAFLSLALPLLICTLPIVEGTSWNNYFPEIYQKLKTGILLTTSFGITATILTSYFEGVTLSKNDEKTIKLVESLNFSIIMIIFLTIVNAIVYGLTIRSEMNFWGVVLQLILYVLVVIFYGYSDNRIKKKKELSTDASEFEKEHKKDIQNLKEKVEEDNTNTFNNLKY
ncbi:hypothetical protein ACWEYK_10625 [Staphylococcus xylosus]